MNARHVFLLCSLATVAVVTSCEEVPTAPPEPEPGCVTHADCGAESPYCQPELGECGEPPPGSELGWGDGTAASVTLTVILEAPQLKQPIDLGFDPSAPNRLWVINRQDDSVVIVTDPGTEGMTFVRKKDPAAAHFMADPPAFEFGAVDDVYGQTFGICGDGDNEDNFMGPALFSSDLDVFATQNEVTGLGSHLDMLHSTTFCRGIAHVEANVFFAFNSAKKSLDKYDFGDDHGPGNDDHEDGQVLRYVQGAVTGLDGVSSHLDYDPTTKLLYVADTGTGRILSLDTASGTVGKSFGGLETIAQRKTVTDAVLSEVVAAGTLQAPSGLELHDGILFVSDNATSTFHAFDLTGQLLRSLTTDLAPGSLGGFTFGPDDKIYFVDIVGRRVLRLDPTI